MLTSLRRLSLLLLSASLFFGCGGDDDGVPLEDVPALAAAGSCAALPACEGDVGDLGTSDYDCDARLGDALTDVALPRWQALVAGGSVVYNGVAMQGCLDAVDAGDCATIRDFPYVGACDAAFEGQLDAGEDCLDSIECSGGATCRFEGACPGTCTMPMPTGTSCDGNLDCAGDSVCDGGTCRAFRGMGASCAEGRCDTGFGCDATSDTCRPWAELRTAALGEDCNETLCALGLSCVLTALDMDGEPITECGEPATAGGPCGVSIPDQCPLGEFCMFGETPMGTCTQLPSAGAACANVGDFLQPRCAPDALCDPDTEMCIAARLDQGAACTGNDQCKTQLCTSGTCAAASECALSEFGE